MLALYGKSATFFSKDIASKLQDLVRQDSKYELLEPMFTTKRISGDLDRLFKMDFLHRKKVKRVVSPKRLSPVRQGIRLYILDFQARMALLEFSFQTKDKRNNIQSSSGYHKQRPT